MSSPAPATDGFNWFHNPEAQRVLPHLKKVFGSESTKECCFAVVDYDQAWTRLSAKCQPISFRQEPMLENFLLGSEKDCAHKLVIVQDICMEAVRDLIRIFDISPEMFESHLSGAQILEEKRPDYTDRSLPDWCTRRLKRDFFSITWPRPFELVANGTRSANKIKLFHGKEQYQAACNIWRMHISFQCDGGQWSPWGDEPSALPGSTPLIADERATLWRGHHKGISFVILLVDVGLGGIWKLIGSPATVEGSTRPGRRKRVGRAPTVLDEANQTNQDISKGPQQQDRPESEQPQKLGTDKTAGRTSTSEVVLDSLVSRHQSQEVEHDTTAFIQNDTRDYSGQAAPAYVVGDKSNGCLKTSIAHAVSECFDSSSRRSVDVIRNLAVRAPCEHLTIKTAFQTGLLSPLTSTLEDLSRWLESDIVTWGEAHRLFGPTVVIQEMISHDVHDSLRVIHDYLNDITDLANDEFLLDKNIGTWRETLHYLRRKLRDMHEDHTIMTKHLSQDERGEHNHQPTTISTPSNCHLSEAITDAQERLHSTYSILENSVSVAEARRGITEAESVTRLTELAFIYVPLSFAASFFGMQVKELNPDTTSIGGFFGLAALVTSLSYCLRLMVRSDNLKKPMERFRAKVREEFRLLEDSPIKTRQVARFTARSVWRWTMYEPSYWPSMTVVLVLGPLIAMITIWANRNLDGDLKIALAIVYVIMGVLIACFVMAFVLKLDVRLRYPQYRQQLASGRS